MRPTILASACLSVCMALGLVAEGKESFKKEFDKTYSINSDATLELETSFGDVTIDNWDQNKIEIHVEVIVDARNEETAEKIFDQIEVTMVGTSSRVELKTDIDMHGNHSGCDWSINITIKAPRTIGLDANHDFGDLRVADISGASDIHVGYGTFKAGKLSNPGNDITVAFGEGSIKEVGGGDISNEFGELDIDRLTGNADLSNGYGEFEIDYVTASCKDIDINNEFGELEITLASGGSFEIEYESSFGDVSLPSSANISRESEEMTSKSGKATIGGSGGCKIRIETSFGEVDIDVD